jgi:ABC-2 type transport system ATP-binding protein
VRVAGRIAPLISLGVGFHQEMSGRENVLVNGMLLGLTAREISQRFDSIVEFAELREVIDTPVKFYSSGMTMRLGFAVVIHVDPTILLVDEILAVGDAAFQLKCLERLRELQRQGAAIVMVSHAMHQIRQLCPRAVLIRQGRVVYDGEVERAIALHYRAISAAPAAGSAPGAVEVLERELIGAPGEDHHANYDESLELRLRVRLQQMVHATEIEFAVKTDSGLLVTAQSAPLPAEPSLEAGEELLVRIAFRARLGGGTYLLSARLTDSAKHDLGGCQDLILFVAGRPGSMGAVDLRASMRIDGVERADRRLTLLG